MPIDVKTLCLGVLNRGEATGYEIKKQCEEGPFSHFYAAGFGSIYPALNALCADRLVSLQAQAQDKRPDKKVYRITAAGRYQLAQALTEPPRRDRFRSDFWFVVFSASLLDPRRVDEILQARIDALKTELAEMANCDMSASPPGEEFTFGAGKAINQAELDYLESNRHVLVGEILRGAASRTSPDAANNDNSSGPAALDAPAAE